MSLIWKHGDSPADKYNIIYADPPWSYDDRGCNGAQAKHYSGLSPEQVTALPVSKLAADNAILLLWVTWPFMERAFDVIRAWGFEYKTVGYVWVKTRTNDDSKLFMGLGRYTRANTEPCLLAVRGKLERMDAGVRQVIESEEEQVIAAPLSKHSQKPHEARVRTERLFGPDTKRVELFARQRVQGWEAWGAGVESRLAMHCTVCNQSVLAGHEHVTAEDLRLVLSINHGVSNG